MTTRMKYLVLAIAMSVAMWAGLILGTLMFWRILNFLL
jgi:hypothetical protein